MPRAERGLNVIAYDTVAVDTLVNFINTRIVPTYQPMEDLFANYNDGQGFNK